MKKATKKAVKKAPAKVPAVIGELERVKGALASIDKVGAGIKALAEKYAGVVFDVRTSKGMAAAKAARHEIRLPRYEVEDIRKAAKKPILDLGRKLDTEANRIKDALLAIEQPIDDLIVAEEQRIENERQAAVQKEQERIAAIDRRIDGIRNLAVVLSAETAADLAKRIKEAEATAFDGYQEFEADARAAMANTLALLRGRHERLADLERREAEVRAAPPSTVSPPPPYTPGALPQQPLRIGGDTGGVVLRTDGQERTPGRPTEAELVDVLEAHYTVAGRQTIIGWLRAADWNKAGVVSARELESET